MAGSTFYSGIAKAAEAEDARTIFESFWPVGLKIRRGTAYGFPMVCNWYGNSNQVFFKGIYGVVAHFMPTLPLGLLFIDIGANRGGTSIFAARVLRQGARNGS